MKPTSNSYKSHIGQELSEGLHFSVDALVTNSVFSLLCSWGEELAQEKENTLHWTCEWAEWQSLGESFGNKHEKNHTTC